MVTTKPIFHRGDTTNAEENTMPAFKAAAARSRGFEFDVHRTASDTFAVIHDDTWDRTTTSTGVVRDTTQSQINGIRTNGGSSIPSLSQVLPLTAQGAAPVLIDWKIENEDTPDAMIQRLNDLVVQNGAETRHFLFTGQFDLMARIQALAPSVRISWRPVDIPYSLQQALDLGVQAIQPAFDSLPDGTNPLTANDVADFQAAGLRVISQDRGIQSKAALDQVRQMGFNYVLINAGKWGRWAT